MAECHGGCAGCEHCQDRAEPDAYAPTGPSVAIVSSGCVVRDLGDAIRAIALAHATGLPIGIAIRGALAIVREADGTHGCDVCDRLRAAETQR